MNRPNAESLSAAGAPCWTGVVSSASRRRDLGRSRWPSCWDATPCSPPPRNPDRSVPGSIPRSPMRRARGIFQRRARNVLVIFCSGAVSQVDTWDYKPELVKTSRHPDAVGPEDRHLPGRAGESDQAEIRLQAARTERQDESATSSRTSRSWPTTFVSSIRSPARRTPTAPARPTCRRGKRSRGIPRWEHGRATRSARKMTASPPSSPFPIPRFSQAAGNNWGSAFLPAQFQGTSFNAASRSGISTRRRASLRRRTARPPIS